MSIETLLSDHFFRYPAMQIQDVYKLLHQAALGSEHAISDPASAQKWMERELAEMGEGPEEDTIDPISPNGQIVRVHLRPYIAQGRDPKTLLTAFIRTANEYHGEKNVLENYWKATTGMTHFSSEDVEHFIEPLRTKNYPAVHHSKIYENTYRPAYRVVLRKLIND